MRYIEKFILMLQIGKEHLLMYFMLSLIKFLVCMIVCIRVHVCHFMDSLFLRQGLLLT